MKDKWPLPVRVESEWKNTDFTIREYGKVVDVIQLPADESSFAVDLSSFADRAIPPRQRGYGSAQIKSP